MKFKTHRNFRAYRWDVEAASNLFYAKNKKYEFILIEECGELLHNSRMERNTSEENVKDSPKNKLQRGDILALVRTCIFHLCSSRVKIAWFPMTKFGLGYLMLKARIRTSRIILRGKILRSYFQLLCNFSPTLIHYTMGFRNITLLEKYPTFFSENPVNFNEAQLNEATSNLHTHTWIFSCLSIASVDGKQHLSEVVYSGLNLEDWDLQVM